jgi:hypothetical protein
MALVTYPLNNIEYSAEDAELFHVTRTSGIYAKNSFEYYASGLDNNIVIGAGIGWIKNSEFSGKVIAQKEPVSIDLGLSDSIYPRIDAIVIQFDTNANETNIVVKKGDASTSPVAPAISRTESLYELHLYHIKRAAGSVSVSASDVTDLRLNQKYCGLMADAITAVDTSNISKQADALIAQLKEELDSAKDGSAYLLRTGGYMKGPLVLLDALVLTENVHYGKEEPTGGVEGQFYLVEIIE